MLPRGSPERPGSFATSRQKLGMHLKALLDNQHNLF